MKSAKQNGRFRTTQHMGGETSQERKFMKRMKKIMAVVLATVMVMAMGVTAFAADGDPTGSITVKPSSTVSLENKTLKAYRILDATYGEADSSGKQPIAYSIPNKMLSFYDNYFKDGDKTASQAAAAAGKTVDQYVAEKIGALDSSGIKDFEYAALAAAKNASVTGVAGTHEGKNVVFTGLEAGYYVIEDEGTAQPISALMLDTVTDANVEIELKASDDTTKKIKTAGELVNEKADEIGLGRAVNYEVTQKIPDTTGYDYFYYMINDTLSDGLTFNPDTVVVKVGDTTLTKGTDYYLYTDAATVGDKTFIIAFEDVVKDIKAKKYATGDTVTITYSATVNSNAISGINPNKNEVYVEYSNNPDKDGRGDSQPGIPANKTDHPTGEGPKKYTDSYTTKVTIVKVDGSDTTKKLAGVEFTLTGKSKDAVFNAEEVFEIDATGTYWLLKNGKYTTTAPTTAPTVEKATGAAGWVEDAAYTGADARVVGGKTYRPYKKADGNVDRYTIVEPNDADYASTTTKYKKVTKTADAAEEYDVARTGVTGSDGTLSFAQLGAGEFTLSETGILPGFNAIEDIPFTVSCTLPDADKVIAGTETAEWSITTDAPGVTFTQENGTFTITIENNSGTELPSTGGIGTTIFYIVGALLVIGAGVIMITRRRMNAQ